MPPRHVDDLFSAAYDDQLSDSQRQWFTAHLHECSPCRTAYEHFQSGIDTLRSMPSARMPIPVHLPSTPPVAEQSPLARLRLPRLLSFRPGLATGLGALGAAVLVAVAVTHQSSTTTGTGALSEAGGGAQYAQQQPAAQCPLPATAASASPPAGFDHDAVKTDPARPGQRLVLATSATRVSAGAQVPVYALLTAPNAAAAAPAAPAASGGSIAAVPCLSVSGASVPARTSNGGGSAAAPAFASPGAALGAPGSADRAGAPLLYFTVPADTPSGTVLHVTATVPAGYPQPGDPALSVELTITVR